jgi:hypothetical protein
MQIEPEVQKVIEEFVESQQSFISLDVYCKLGTHFDPDTDNPIHEQVRAAYSTNLMPNYLCKWVCLRLEGGGYANCWKYYVPKISVQRYKLVTKPDGKIELSKKVLGTFALLECSLGLHVEKEKIIYKLLSGDEEYIVDASNKIVIAPGVLKKAGLDRQKVLAALVYPNRIEIQKVDSSYGK